MRHAKTRKAQTIACRMTFYSLRPLRETQKLQTVISLIHGHIIADCPTFARHQIIKIAAALFARISAFFRLKMRVVELCKKVL